MKSVAVSSKSEYPVILGSSHGDGYVGIWWYTDTGVLWSFQTPTELGFNNGTYIEYSEHENHMTLWRQAVAEFSEDGYEYCEGYKSLERGRVVYNLRTQSYEILCSDFIRTNAQFRNTVLLEYNLRSARRDFFALRHYYKAPLTGNPAIDNLNYD